MVVDALGALIIRATATCCARYRRAMNTSAASTLCCVLGDVTGSCIAPAAGNTTGATAQYCCDVRYKEFITDLTFDLMIASVVQLALACNPKAGMLWQTNESSHASLTVLDDGCYDVLINGEKWFVSSSAAEVTIAGKLHSSTDGSLLMQGWQRGEGVDKGFGAYSSLSINWTVGKHDNNATILTTSFKSGDLFQWPKFGLQLQIF